MPFCGTSVMIYACNTKSDDMMIVYTPMNFDAEPAVYVSLHTGKTLSR
jgi:hypothetical protein